MVVDVLDLSCVGFGEASEKGKLPLAQPIVIAMHGGLGEVSLGVSLAVLVPGLRHEQVPGHTDATGLNELGNLSSHLSMNVYTLGEPVPQARYWPLPSYHPPLS